MIVIMFGKCNSNDVAGGMEEIGGLLQSGFYSGAVAKGDNKILFVGLDKDMPLSERIAAVGTLKELTEILGEVSVE